MTILTPILVHPHTLPTTFNLYDWVYPPYEPCLDWHDADKKYVVNTLSHTGINHRDPETGFDTGVAAGYLNWELVGAKTGGNRADGTPNTRNKGHMRYKINFKNGCYGVSDMIWLLKTGHWPKAGMMIDHVTDDALCNQHFNLQLFTRSLNIRKVYAQRHADLEWAECMYAAGYDWFPRPELAIGANGGPPLDAAA